MAGLRSGANHLVRALRQSIPLTGIIFCTASCSLSPFISLSSVDYNRTVEYATTSILVTNILRARDAAPLFFSDLSQIHGSLALNLSTQETIPFGPLHASTTRASAQAGPIAVNSTPSFDIAPLNTKQFYQGILEPLTPNVLGYWLQRGVDPNVILNLFISRLDAYETIGDGDTASHRLVESVSWMGTENDGLARTLTAWAGSKFPPLVRIERQSKNYGPVLDANLQSIVAANSAGLEVSTKGTKGIQVQLIKQNTFPVLCVALRSGRRIAVGINQNSVVKAPSELKIPSDDSVCGQTDGNHNAGLPPRRYVVTLRSVEGMFYYLGTLVPLQHPPIPFHLSEHSDGDVWLPVTYRGREYYIHNFSDDDATVTILAILSDLLNTNRDAAEIPTTKSVTVQ